jgi:MFS family permease
MNGRRTYANLAIIACWVLVALGLAIELLAIPEVSRSLSTTYVEYEGQQVIIQAILTALVGLGQITLALIALLLNRVKNRKLLEPSSSRFTYLLALAFMLVAATLAGLTQWLISRNTLPPYLSIFLIASILTCVIGSLVTIALTEVLKEATSARQELESVI